MKKATLILLVSLSFFVFNLQLADAQGEAFDHRKVAPWRLGLGPDFLRMVNRLESAESLHGLEASDHKKVHLRIAIEGSDADRIGLREERVRNKCELRLRQAGLEPTPSTTPGGGRLKIIVLVQNRAFSIQMQFSRDVIFEANGRSYYTTASTWDTAGVGEHGKSPNHILQSLDDCFDSFLNEYLKANANPR